MEFIEKAGHSGIMVALYPGHTVQNNIAMEGGESPSSLHITLAYLPGIGSDQEAFDAVCEAVGKVAEEFAPVNGWIGGIGLFNGSAGSDNKDVFYASFNAPGLPVLRQEVVEAIEEAGCEISHAHGYSPHITLKYVDPQDPIPQQRRKTSPFDILQLSVVSKLGRKDFVLTGGRVLKGLPTSSDVHVPTAGSEEDDKPKARVAEQDTEHSDLVIPPPVDNLETDLLKAAMDLVAAFKGSLPPEEEEFEETDPATADDAWPMELAGAALGVADNYSKAEEHDRQNLQQLEQSIDQFIEEEAREGDVERAEKIAKALEGRYLDIRKADPKKQVVYCVVTEPHTVDSQEDWMTPEDIEETAHAYMLESRVIGKNHRAVIKAAPVESYIAPQDLNWSGGPYGHQVVKRGSWVVGIKVFDKAEWAKVESGDYQGVSISGWGHRSAA